MVNFVSVPQFHEFETPESFVSRLAAFNCLDSVKELYSLLGCSIYDYRDGLNATIALVTEMAGLHRDVSHRYALVRHRDYAWIGDQKVRPIDLCRLQHRLCPMCIQRDLETGTGPVAARAYQRAWWWYLPVQRCVDHGCEIQVMAQVRDAKRPDDFTTFVGDNLHWFRNVAMPSPISDVHPFEDYVVNRIKGEPPAVPVPFIDAMPLYVMVNFCDAVGRLFVRGHRKGQPRDGQDNMDIYRKRGFELLSQGPDALLASLHERVVREATDARLTRLQKYGPIYRALERHADDPDWAVPIDLIREDALATIPLGPGDEVLGQTVRSRRLHNLTTASAEYGVHRRTVTKLLRQQGMEIADDGYFDREFIVFEADRFHDVLTQIRNSSTKPEVCLRLGITSGTVKALRNHKIINAIDVEGVFGDRNPRYVTSDVDRVVAELEAMPLVHKPSIEYRPIETVHKWAHVSSAQVFTDIRSGKVRALRMNNRPVFGSVLVHAEDTWAASQMPAHGWLPIYEAARELSTSDRSVKRLIKLGYLRAEVKPHPVTRRTAIYIDPVSVQDFDQLYVGQTIFTREIRLSVAKFSLQLKEARVEPLFEPTVGEARFYKRSVLEKFVA